MFLIFLYICSSILLILNLYIIYHQRKTSKEKYISHDIGYVFISPSDDRFGSFRVGNFQFAWGKYEQ